MTDVKCVSKDGYIVISSQGVTRIGVWDSKFVQKFNWTKPAHSDQSPDEGTLQLRNRTLRVTTIMVTLHVHCRHAIQKICPGDANDNYGH